MTLALNKQKLDNLADEIWKSAQQVQSLRVPKRYFDHFAVTKYLWRFTESSSGWWQ
jgi:hypothetical protein